MADLKQLIDDTVRQVTAELGQISCAEEEIEKAQTRHPNAAERIWHGFMLLQPTHKLMSTDFVYRAHVRELLERVAAGEDTRLGTWAEIVCVCHDVSLRVPLHGAIFGLYCRAWNNAFPDMPMVDPAHYEALHGSEIDDEEFQVRRKLSVVGRKLAPAAKGGRS